MHTRPPHAGGILFSLFVRLRPTELATATAVEGEVSGLPWRVLDTRAKSKCTRLLGVARYARCASPATGSSLTRRILTGQA